MFSSQSFTTIHRQNTDKTDHFSLPWAALTLHNNAVFCLYSLAEKYLPQFLSLCSALIINVGLLHSSLRVKCLLVYCWSGIEPYGSRIFETETKLLLGGGGFTDC